MKQLENKRRFIPTDHAMECPFCGSSSLKLVDMGDTAWVACNDCQAIGPSGQNAVEALVRWNLVK
ncbi:MAG: hypothetical protein H6R18_169 [Proteobacteria bacterium]|nr:hypothetical protein [Pseudomonadota bacterium]